MLYKYIFGKVKKEKKNQQQQMLEGTSSSLRRMNFQVCYLSSMFGRFAYVTQQDLLSLSSKVTATLTHT